MARGNQIFVDLEDSGSADLGTAAEPYNTTTSAEANIIDDCQVTFTGTSPQTLDPVFNGFNCPNKTGVTFDTDIGGGCILQGWIDASGGWTLRSGTVYYKDVAITTDAGCIRHNGTMLNYVARWVNAATTLPLIGVGEYAIAFNDGTEAIGVYRLFVNTGGDPFGDTILSSASGSFSAPNGGTDLIIDGLTFEGFGRAVIKIDSWVGFEVMNCILRDSGGNQGTNGEVPVGSGIQGSGNLSNGSFHDNTITDVFDSPISLQNFVGSRTISGVDIYNNTCQYGALGGMEISNWIAGDTMEDLHIYDNTISDMGAGWSGEGDDATVHGILFTSGINVGNTFTTVIIEGNTIDGSTQWGIRLKNSHSIGNDNIIIRKNLITNCETGIENYCVNAGVVNAPTVRSNIITDCTLGIVHDDNQTSDDAIYEQNTILDCGIGFHNDRNPGGGVPQVTLNIIEGGTIGILVDPGHSINNTYNNVNAGVTNFSGLSADVTDTEVDPELILGVATGKVADQVYPTTYSPIYHSGPVISATNDYHGNAYNASMPTRGAIEFKTGSVKSAATGIYLPIFDALAVWT